MNMGTKRKGITMTPDIVERERALDYLQPIVEATNGVFGSQQRLKEFLEARLGRKLTRHQVNRWLHADRAKRQIPFLGIGLLLLEAFNANKKLICEPWDAATRRRPRGSVTKRKSKTQEKSSSSITI